MTLLAGSATWPITVLTVSSPTIRQRGSIADFRHRGIELAPALDAYSVLCRLSAEPGAVVVAPTDLPDMPIANFIDIVVSLTQTPVLVGLAAALPDGLVEDCLGRGARGMVALPLTPARLASALQPLRQQAVEAVEVPLHHGALTLNSLEHRVLVADTEVHLSLKEFQVLDYLLRAAPSLVSIEELVHKFAAGDDERAMRVRIAVYRIRSKLSRAAPGLAPFIETVRGVGYRIAG